MDCNENHHYNGGYTLSIAVTYHLEQSIFMAQIKINAHWDVTGNEYLYY